ncbi:uncharacterized protein V1510DRAFT_127784 [Dipodascopsis tothii]|uniref:uncharacterized protein n=1 Tax=Dipodascopsis tothii TaxID=44089 RepID=UPI0034CFD0F6
MATATTTVTETAVQAKLNFFKAPESGEDPYTIVYEVPEGTPTRNWGDDPQDVAVRSIRGRETDFSLDRNGFCIDRRTHAETDFTDDEQIAKNYYPGVIAAVKEITGAKRVIVFDHTIRLANSYRTPVMFVHVDQTPKSAADRVRLHCPEDADVDELLAGRYQIINYWKPIGGPALKDPLAVGDALSAKDEDVVSVQHRYRERTGATGMVRYNPGQEFYYWPQMSTEEALLLKCYDTKPGVAARTPHTAFVDPTAAADAPERKSIEVRTLVFY